VRPDAQVSGQAVPHPSNPDPFNVVDARNEPRLPLDAGDDGGVDGVHEAFVDLSGGTSQHGEDGDGDDEPDDWIGLLDPCGHADRSEGDGQGGEPVGASVVAISHQGGGTDGVALPDPEQGDQFVADEPDRPGGEQDSYAVDGPGVDESGDRLPSGHDC